MLLSVSARMYLICIMLLLWHLRLSNEDEWIEAYSLQYGNYEILAVDRELVQAVSGAAQMGKVHQRLIDDTL